MRKNQKGFTLAELLIVVAIIAVLVAIAIPIFTSQLERSREATDLSNIRSYYAEINSALLVGDLRNADNTITVAGNLEGKLVQDLPTVSGGTFDVVVTGTNLKFQQTQEGWQTAEFDIAGLAKSTAFAADADAWNKDDNRITYTYELADDGDYVLKSIKIDKAS